jgi:hypothetical protein
MTYMIRDPAKFQTTALLQDEQIAAQVSDSPPP